MDFTLLKLFRQTYRKYRMSDGVLLNHSNTANSGDVVLSRNRVYEYEGIHYYPSISFTTIDFVCAVVNYSILQHVSDRTPLTRLKFFQFTFKKSFFLIWLLVVVFIYKRIFITEMTYFNTFIHILITIINVCHYHKIYNIKNIFL